MYVFLFPPDFVEGPIYINKPVSLYCYLLTAAFLYTVLCVHCNEPTAMGLIMIIVTVPQLWLIKHD